MTNNAFLKRLKNIEASNKAQQFAAIISLKHSNRDLKEWLIKSTSFILKSPTMTQRMYCVINNITSAPLCYCGKFVRFYSYTEGYQKYCSSKCGANCPESKERKKQTCRDRYGSDTYLGTKDCLNKTKATIRKKYGVDNIKQVEFIKEKGRKTSLKKYGTESHTQNKEWQEKQKERTLKKYGTTCSMNAPEILDAIEKKHGYRHFMNTKEFRTKTKQTLEKKYGVDNIFQVPEIRKKADAAIKKLYGTENYKQSHYINMKYWDNAEFIKEQFITNKTVDYKKAIKFFNATYQTLLNHFKEDLKLDISNQGISQDEKDIINFVKQLVPGINVNHNIRNLINYTDADNKKRYKEIDIYLPDYNLAIEFDGIYFHSIGTHGHTASKDEHKRRRVNSSLKTTILHQKNIKLLTIWENEWYHENKHLIWKSMIRVALGKSRRIFARKCEIRNITAKEEIAFLNTNHMQGYVGGASHRIGLFYKNKLLSIMTFGKSRFKDNLANFELLRFAVLRKHTVIGGASKLLSYFRRLTNYASIISYANRRWSDGNMYEVLGFVKIKETNPQSYFFLNTTSSRSPKMYHWTALQKYKLDKMLINFDPELSAEKNLYANHYRKIYDAGQLVYLLE